MRTVVQTPKAAPRSALSKRDGRSAVEVRPARRNSVDDTWDTKEDQRAPAPPVSPAHDLRRIPIHPPAATLAINSAGDKYEQNAERIARKVLEMPQAQATERQTDPGSRQSPLPMQMAAPTAATHVEAAPIVQGVLTAAGRPLDSRTRAFMEPRFGADFGNVRVHADSSAAISADAVQARAFTVGHQIVLGASEYAPGTPAGRALLAHELAHVVQQTSMATGRAMLLQREPLGPTYGNLPRDMPAPGSSGDVVRLRQVNGSWKEVGPKYTRTARGNYDFVVKDKEIFAVKTKRTLGGGYGHTEAARGERVNWAGQVEFEGGKVKTWNDGSGHYRSLSSMRQPAVDAGMPKDKFVQHVETAPRPRPKSSLPQLPVEQPATKPRVPGEPPKVGAGPPRMAEFEARYGKAPTAVPATAASTVVAEEATSVLKVSGRTASALGKIGSAAGWVADFLMPGPQDAIMLMVQFAMTYAEAQDAARAEGMRTGFGHGLCAGLLRLSRGWIRDNLAPKVISRSVASEVAATTGYREKGVVQGLVAGISFAERLSADQRKALIKEATRAMRAKGDDMTLRARWERGYTANDIIDMSVALAPRITEILEEAQKNEELRQAAENWKKFKKYGPLMPLEPLFKSFES